MESENASDQVTQDERIMAALSHGGVVLPIWGLIGAVVIWATQREKSPFVRFQALQGIVYQAILILASFLGWGCYACSIFAVFPLMAMGGLAAEATTGTSSAGGLVAMITFFLPFCIAGLLLLFGLAYLAYGLYGAVRVLQGHDFRYAVIGRKLEQYLNQEESAA